MEQCEIFLFNEAFIEYYDFNCERGDLPLRRSICFPIVQMIGEIPNGETLQPINREAEMPRGRVPLNTFISQRSV